MQYHPVVRAEPWRANDRRDDAPTAGNPESVSRRGHSWFAVGRLKPSATLERARTELTTIAARLERQYPDTNAGRGVTAVGLHDELVGDVRPTLYLLWGVAGLVLLIACANTATLLLGKATGRTREVAMRTALGASRPRIIRQLLAESLLLALIAGVAGVLLAHWGSRGLVALAPAEIVRRLATGGVDATMLAFTLPVSAATSVLFGLVPALHASRVDLSHATRRGGARGVAGGSLSRARGALVACEIALAVMLLTGAGLLLKSLVALGDVELGYRPENVLVMQATGVRPAPEGNAFFTEVLSRLHGFPGVVAAGATSIPPGNLSRSGSGVHYVDRRPETPDSTREPRTLFNIVAPGTFAALGIPVRGGREFEAGDTADRPLVAIVNEALVRESFGVADPLGRTIFCPFDRDDGMTIVGVVGDTRQRNPGVPPAPECYMPFMQHAYNGNTLHVVVRTEDDPTALAGAARRLAAEVSPEVPVSFTTMRENARRHGGGAGVSHAPVRPVRGSGPLPGRGGRLRRDGRQRPAAFEGDRTEDCARRGSEHGVAPRSRARSRPHPGRTRRRSGGGGGRGSSSRDDALRGGSPRRIGVSGCGSAAGRRRGRRRLPAGAARGSHRPDAGAERRLSRTLPWLLDEAGASG